MDLEEFLKEVIRAFLVILPLAAILKSISILMKGQSEGVAVKESLQKVKTVIKATIVCLCITSIVAVLRSYF